MKKIVTIVAQAFQPVPQRRLESLRYQNKRRKTSYHKLIFTQAKFNLYRLRRYGKLWQGDCSSDSKIAKSELNPNKIIC